MRMNINTDQKIATGVVGLDALFFDGIQLRQFSRESTKVETNRKDDNLPGVIIIVKGPRGVDKTLLVMQMLHGLTKSMQRSLTDRKILGKSCFYSLNKPQGQLKDMLLDTIISKMTYTVTKDYLKNNESWGKSEFCNFLFDTNPSKKIKIEDEEEQKEREGIMDNLPKDFKEHLDKYLAEEIIYYNNRTNSLHIRREKKSDDSVNLLFRRKHDEIDSYVNDENIATFNENLKNDFFSINFNSHIEYNRENFSYSYSALEELRLILSNIEKRKDNKEKIAPCLVLDGITQLALDELHNINFSHIEQVFRQNALFSILVFDDTEDITKCSADIVIEMRRMEDKKLNYSYHQLRISKCVFQQVAYGWHQYKKRDYGIEVYPSSHLLIQKRRHMPKILRTAHADILDENYEKYLERSINENVEKSLNYNSYLEQQKKHEWQRLKELNVKYKEWEKEGYNLDVLRNILCNDKPKGNVTALIGPPNTYKRLLATGYVFSACNMGQHSLYTLLDRDERSMSDQMVCPGMFEKDDSNRCTKECLGCSKEGCKLQRCKECYSNIHFFDIRMGCIGSDELFHYLKEQINLAHGKDNKTIQKIVVDDLQKIDYSFPFLKQDNLFLTVLISLCKDLNVDLLILCDENAQLKDELIALSDNVIRTERTYENDFKKNQITLHIEKYIEGYLPSQTYSYKISEIQNLFFCKEKGKKRKFAINDMDKVPISITVNRTGENIRERNFK